MNPNSNFDIQSYLTPTIACLTFIAIQFSLKYFSISLLYNIIYVNFFGLIFHFFSPGLFISIFSWTVGRDIKITDTSGARGASGFAAEPGFAGAVAVVCLAALCYFWKSLPSRGRRFLLAMCFIMIVITKSGSGSLLFILFVLGFFIERGKMRIFYIIPILVFSYLLLLYYPSSRGVSVIQILFTNPQYLWQVDTSTGHRVFNIVIGYLTLQQSPLGNGVGSYDTVSAQIVDLYNLTAHISGLYTNISAFAKLSVEFGFIFIVLILLINFLAFRRNGLPALKYLLVANAMIGVSFSFMFPPTWLLYSFALARRAR